MLIPAGPIFQAPNTTVAWNFGVYESPFTVIHFVGFSCPAYGTTLTWGVHGMSRWYSIEPDGRALQWFNVPVTKTGGGIDDYFWVHMQKF